MGGQKDGRAERWEGQKYGRAPMWQDRISIDSRQQGSYLEFFLHRGGVGSASRSTDSQGRSAFPFKVG